MKCFLVSCTITHRAFGKTDACAAISTARSEAGAISQVEKKFKEIRPTRLGWIFSKVSAMELDQKFIKSVAKCVQKKVCK